MFDLFAVMLGEMWLSIPGIESEIFTGPTRFATEIEDGNAYCSIDSQSGGIVAEISEVAPDSAYTTLTPN